MNFFANAWANIVLWYHTKVQATMGWVLAGFSATDLLAAMTSYEQDLVHLLGVKAHAAIRLCCAAVVIYRARQVTSKP
jgi:hypothetical protein